MANGKVMARVQFAISMDTMRPKLRALTAMGKDTTPVMRAMGTTFKSITEGAFNSVGASYRPRAWAAKRDGTPSILQLSGLLAHSFHLVVTKDRATLSNPTKYAAVHQFGGVIKPKAAKALRFRLPDGTWRFAKQVTMPARPFYPVDNGKLTVKAEEKIVAAGNRVVQRLMEH